MLKEFWLTILFGLILFSYRIDATPLDDYVNAPDDHYNYELLHMYKQVEKIVKNPVWWHYLSVSVPDKITRPDAAFMYIEGGNNGDSLPVPEDNILEIISSFAVSSQAIGVDLRQIPNQPTVFKKDPKQQERYEDAVIAWTWKEFIENTSDPEILLRLPMTKAAVRAMDAVIDFASKQNIAKIEKFMVAGASKRGWTIWTTAAVDKRVFSAVPIVMDMLRLNQNLHVHYTSLGGWTFAFDDYYQLNITKYVDTIGMFALEKIIDPSTYLDRYTNKQIFPIVTAGDEFFLNDDTHSFWKDLVSATDGSVLMRRIPNAEHSCAGHAISIFLSIRSMFLSLYEKKPLPRIFWSRPNNKTHGIIMASVDKSTGATPFDVKVYHALTLSKSRRDFRLAIADPNNPSKPKIQPVIWHPTISGLKTTEDKQFLNYEIAFANPSTGWLGFFNSIQL